MMSEMLWCCVAQKRVRLQAGCAESESEEKSENGAGKPLAIRGALFIWISPSFLGWQFWRLAILGSCHVHPLINHFNAQAH